MEIPYTRYKITLRDSAIIIALLTLIIISCLLLPILLGIPFLTLAPLIGVVIGSIIAAFILNSQKEGEEANKGLTRSLAKILGITLLTLAVPFILASLMAAAFSVTTISIEEIIYTVNWLFTGPEPAFLILLECISYGVFFSLTAVMNINNAENPKKALYPKNLLLALAIFIIGIGLGFGLLIMGMPFAVVAPIIGIYSAIAIAMNVGKEDYKKGMLKVALKIGLAIIGIGVGIGLGFAISALAITSMPLALCVGFTVGFGLAVFNKTVSKSLFSPEKLSTIEEVNHKPTPAPTKTPSLHPSNSSSLSPSLTDNNNAITNSQQQQNWVTWFCS